MKTGMDKGAMDPLLSVENLRVSFGPVKAVDGVSLHIDAGETLGLVGESGCGKSTLARAIIRIQKLDSGHIRFRGQDFDRLERNTLRRARRDIQMVFQDPYSSLNPRMPIHSIIADPLRNNSDLSGAEIVAKVVKLVDQVGLPMRALNAYPHELSGGQRQRVGIARALALDPAFIICDEAISALDVSIQAQIINLLQDLQKDLGLTYLFIAHDIAVVRHVSDRIAVMYLGKVVEVGSADELCRNPQHPYTKALLAAVPIPDPIAERRRWETNAVIKGDITIKAEDGCKFAPRCPMRNRVKELYGIDCATVEPALRRTDGGHLSACHLSNPPN
jgi:oligopeptide/dipeptide ABC transporter ATP-binding protein